MADFDTMIALVSDQRMQNIIPLYQRNLNVRQVALVVSRRGERPNPTYVRVAQEIIAALQMDARFAGNLPVEVEAEAIEPYDLRAAQYSIEKLLDNYGAAQTLVNLTGGTKPMSIGAYAAAQLKDAAAIYVDTAETKLNWLEPDGVLRSEPFNLHPITVATALAAHGRRIHKKTTTRQPSERQLEFIRALEGRFGGLEKSIRTVSGLIKLGGGGRGWPKRFPLSRLGVDRGVLRALRQSQFVEFVENELVIQKPAWDFLSGKWLEAYVYTALLDSGRFDDVQMNVSLAGVENEMDVFCTLNGRLALLECKAGWSLAQAEALRKPAEQTKQGRKKRKRKPSVGQPILNKLRVLKDLSGGIFAQAFVVTPLPRTRINQSFRERAADYGITAIISRGELGRIVDTVYEFLSRQL